MYLTSIYKLKMYVNFKYVSQNSKKGKIQL